MRLRVSSSCCELSAREMPSDLVLLFLPINNLQKNISYYLLFEYLVLLFCLVIISVLGDKF